MPQQPHQYLIDRLLQHGQALLKFLLLFVRDPLAMMTQLPPIPGWIVAVWHVLSATMLAVLGALLNGQFLGIFWALLFAPIATAFFILCASGLVYYLLLYYFKVRPQWDRSLRVVAIAFLPNLFFQIPSIWLPPLFLVATLASTLLLIVGVSHLHNLPRRSVAKIFFAVYLIFVVIWLSAMITNYVLENSLRDQSETRPKVTSSFAPQWHRQIQNSPLLQRSDHPALA